MIYLKEEEIPIYCGLVNGITMAHVEAASILIDAYKGYTLDPTQHVERVDLVSKRSTNELRGKLKHFPRIKVEKVTTKLSSPFGSDTVELNVDCLDFDDSGSLYFSFIMPRELMFRRTPTFVNVTYTSGYEEPPEAIKRACGILAGNIKQMGGVMRWKQRDDYDIKVTLADEGVFTEEVKAILRRVDVL